MQFKIGSSLFIGGASKFHLSPSVQGLDAPDIRTGDGVYAGRDGGYVSGHFYGQRLITLKGFYIGEDCDDAANLRKELLGYMKIRYALPIVITDFGGTNYYTEGFVKDIKSTIDNPRAGEFQISLLCPDPFLYNLSGGLEEQNTWFSTTLTANTTTTINNQGTVETFPIFRFTGVIENPVLTNTTTLQTFALNLPETSAGDELVINMKRRIVTLNGSTISSYRTTSSSWWSLLPGQNQILFEDDESGGSSKTGTLSYQYGRSGI